MCLIRALAGRLPITSSLLLENMEVSSVIRAAVLTATLTAGVVVYRKSTEVNLEMDQVELINNRRRRKLSTERRQLRRTAAKWLAEHNYPVARDHSFVFRLFTEMGDHPLDRDYYVIARKRLARWFAESWTYQAAAKALTEHRIGVRPDPEDDPDGTREFDEAYEEAKLEVLAGMREDPVGFSSQWSHVFPSVKPPVEVEYRYSCQIIEAAIAMRVHDVEVTQNVLRSRDVRELGTESVGFWNKLRTWKAGLTGWVPRAPPSLPAGSK